MAVRRDGRSGIVTDSRAPPHAPVPARRARPVPGRRPAGAPAQGPHRSPGRGLGVDAHATASGGSPSRAATRDRRARRDVVAARDVRGDRQVQQRAGTAHGRDDDRRVLAQLSALDDRALDRILALAARRPVAPVQDRRPRPGSPRRTRSPAANAAASGASSTRPSQREPRCGPRRGRRPRRRTRCAGRRRRATVGVAPAASSPRAACPSAACGRGAGSHMRSASIAASSRSCVTSTIGIASVAAQLGELAVELLPRHAVDRGERLVEQQHLRVARERARHRDALLLAAGELRAAGAPRGPSRCTRASSSRARARALAARQVRERRRRRCPARTGAGTARSSGTRGRPSAAAACASTPAAGVEPRRRRRTRSRPAARRDAGPAMQRRIVDLPLPDGPTSASSLARRAVERRAPAGSARPARGGPRARARRSAMRAVRRGRAVEYAIAIATSDSAEQHRRHDAGAARCRTPARGRRSRSRWCASRRGCCRRPSARRRTRPACARTSAPCADRMPGQASGSSMRAEDAPAASCPQHAAASRTSAGIASNARCIGWIANGRLNDDRREQQAREAEHQRAGRSAPRTRGPSGESRAERRRSR